MLEQYVYKNRKKLRCGYTTGSCAAAAAKAAAEMLLGGKRVETVELVTPSGQKLLLDVEEISREKERVSCGIRKDSGDDPDVTNGILVFAAVERTEGGFRIEGGTGVGRVTLPGLDQPVGEAAINTVPRQMITRAVEEICAKYGFGGGIRVLVSIPEGVRLAGKTFNPRLGIEGGISVLGTTGIVEPMSEAALLDTIEVEMRQRAAQGWKKIILTPGNYGMDFLKEELQLEPEKSVKCSNFIGEALDKAMETGFESVLLIGHIGKLVKLGAGVMNTHSRWADARLETLASCLILAGGDAKTAAALLHANTTEEALEILWEKGPFEETMAILLEKIAGHLEHRTGGAMRTEAVVFSNKFGILGETKGAGELLCQLKTNEGQQP
ncbi:cobalt-precorrin-5B (C(1))-methyltransferase CbiD [Eisenbergiella sp.]